MRNTELEEKLLNRVFAFAGAGFIFGFVALAIGTEMWVLTHWTTSPVLFWVYQGLWAIVFSIVISGLARIARRG